MAFACEEKSSELSKTDTSSISPSTLIKILPLGDSITQGGRGFASYRRSLWFLLQDAGYKVDFIGSQNDFSGDVADHLKNFDLDHEGHWGWEAGELNNKLTDWLEGYTPDIVLLHAGTNDFGREQSNIGTIRELESIIDKLRKDNSAVIILIAKIIPMKNKDTFSINQEIEALVNTKNTQETPVIIVDQYLGYEPFSDNYNNVHPNTLGEDKIANKWFNTLKKHLKKR